MFGCLFDIRDEPYGGTLVPTLTMLTVGPDIRLPWGI